MIINQSADSILSRKRLVKRRENPMRPLIFVLLCADSAVLLASVRRQYFRAELRIIVDFMVCMALSIVSVTPLDAGSCLRAAADTQVHVVVTCCCCGRGHSTALLPPPHSSCALARHDWRLW